jgi:hypothetical protein
MLRIVVDGMKLAGILWLTVGSVVAVCCGHSIEPVDFSEGGDFFLRAEHLGCQDGLC